jgi:hypothetical protein
VGIDVMGTNHVTVEKECACFIERWKAMAIKRQKKPCIKCQEKGDNSLKWIYARDMCQYHYQKEQFNKSKARKQQKISNNSPFSSEVELFEYLWATTPQKSFLTGEAIKISRDNDLWYSIFAHVLPKGKYPQFRLMPWNIVFLNPCRKDGRSEHHAFDQMAKSDRERFLPDCNWNKLEKYKMKLLRKYVIKLQ